MPAPPTSAEAGSSEVGRWALAVPLVLLTGLALWGLGRRGLWIDEAISVGATNELWPTLKGTGGTMAMYYALLTPWSAASTSREWLRVLSVLFALAALVAMWSAVRRAFDRTTATVATTFAAGSWIVVRYAQEARSFTLALLLTSLAWCALIAAVRADDDADERRRWWVVFAVASIVAPLAHGLTVLQLLGQVGFLAAGPDRRTWLLRVRPVFIGVVAVTGVLILAGAKDIASWIPPIDREQLAELVAAFTAPQGWGQVVLGLLVVLGTVACIQRRRQLSDPVERWFAVLPVAWGLVPVAALVAISIVRPYLVARYVAGAAPGVALLLAFAVLGPTLRPTWRRALPAGLAIAVVLAAGQVHLHRDRGDDWRGAAAIVAADAVAGDAIVLPNPSLRSAFDQGWSEVAGDEAGAVSPDPISPVEPIGDVRRFYVIVDPNALGATIAEAAPDRLWVVDQERPEFALDDGRWPADPVLADAAVDDAYRVVERRSVGGGIDVVLLERR